MTILDVPISGVSVEQISMTSKQVVSIMIFVIANIATIIVLAFRTGGKVQHLDDEIKRVEGLHISRCNQCDQKFMSIQDDGKRLEIEVRDTKFRLEEEMKLMSEKMDRSKDILHRIDKAIGEHIAFHKGTEKKDKDGIIS